MAEKTPVYFISGLGIDERALSKIHLPGNFEMRFLRWIEPEKNEAFRDYCRRLTAGVDFSSPVIFAGMSFGGITACEISRMLPVKKIILLSSIGKAAELPKLYRLLGLVRMNRWLPSSWVTRTWFFTNWLFGVHTDEEIALLKAIMADISENFLRWSTETVLRWDNQQVPENAVRIHGTRDRVLYFRKEETEFPVKDAGHFMVYTHADEVNAALEQVLQ